jgi:hypothetical protein
VVCGDRPEHVWVPNNIVPRKEPLISNRADSPRWALRGRAERSERSTALTSRRGLRVEVKRHGVGWAVRPGDHPDVAWAHCADGELEHTLGLTLGLDRAEARALAHHVRSVRE